MFEQADNFLHTFQCTWRAVEGAMSFLSRERDGAISLSLQLTESMALRSSSAELLVSNDSV